ncbi:MULTISPECIES: helix-turn-helix domain-containing protein [Pseudomonas]|uniref:Helix-turn-helix domain-containing protein n=1 Tax=Pseudomonas sessilinigenes TaxID=658629 RepID=A0ABX8MFY4_9PSED|nr:MULTISPECIES: helix-turn-helix domain-containing protein [Pseudomonas]AZC25003.1 Transcriptional regulator, AraC family [Pseudomonas sessilinigenes]QIH10209.1 AraC family transcriptional regulator [Pseudomonas sp. BIOMIG1BAC]QXH38043.1 helix-turn-helix domain-containing protein [Pseudomonas sessilinigenes]
MPASRWNGELWLGRDFGLVHGHMGPTTAHAHYAHQLIIAPGQPVTVELDGVRRSGHYLLIEALCRHAIVQAPEAAFTVYAEPLSIDARDLHQSMCDVTPTLPDLEAALRTCRRQPMADQRVERALQALDASLDGKVAAAQLAVQANVSLSQLERLFARDVGLPVRRLVLWRRLRLAMALMLQGMPMTQAAHDAGFADAAHFSRTLKALFGITAGQALKTLKTRLLA